MAVPGTQTPKNGYAFRFQGIDKIQRTSSLLTSTEAERIKTEIDEHFVLQGRLFRLFRNFGSDEEYILKADLPFGIYDVFVDIDVMKVASRQFTAGSAFAEVSACVAARYVTRPDSQIKVELHVVISSAGRAALSSSSFCQFFGPGPTSQEIRTSTLIWDLGLVTYLAATKAETSAKADPAVNRREATSIMSMSNKCRMEDPLSGCLIRSS